MAREDVEAIERFFKELNQVLLTDESLGDLARRYVDQDCVAELGRMEGTFTGGPEGFARYFEGQRAIVDDMQIDPEEFIDVGDHRVVMPFHLHGRARETGLPIDFRYTQLFTMREGKFTHARMYASKESALAAAGR
jgi:ketosteroid isomerase-like protein